MRLITKAPVIGADYRHIQEKKYHRIQCECGNVLYVWTNRNDCTCHRARCLRCKNDGSYMVEWVERASGMRATLITINDTYAEWEAALMRSDCEIAKSVPDLEEDVYVQAYLDVMK